MMGWHSIGIWGVAVVGWAFGGSAEAETAGPLPAVTGGGHRFVEVTQEAGIDFRYINGASGDKNMVEAVGSGAAFFDADGDGWLDLYIVNGAPMPGYERPTAGNAHFRNMGDATFKDVTAQAGTGDTAFGMGAAVGDFDNDGDADLYLSNYGPNVLYRNRGDGVFDDISAQAGVDDPRWGVHAAFVDYDMDGDLDLYNANYMNFDPAKNEACFAGTERAYCGPTTYEGQEGVLYRNDGDAVFTDVTRQAGLADDSGRQLAAVFGDCDNDGDPDLFIANDKRPNFYFINNGDGTFEENGAVAGVAYNEEGLAESAMGADLGDYDNDGRLDIVVATFQWLPNTLYHNDGDGFFTDVTFAADLGVPSVPYLGMTAAFLDYDNDGYLDVFVANGHLDENVKAYDPATSYPQQNQIFRNLGDGTFGDMSDKSGPGMQVKRVSHGAVFGDYDNDGDVDIFVSDSDTPHCTLLRNDGAEENHYLVLTAIGTQGNREAIGARVRAVAGDLVQTREIRRAYGYMGSNDVRLTLGLGRHTAVDTLEIRWPGGRLQRLTDIEADRFIVVEEDAAP
jgi:enediyne biosynthesis protein E4